MQVAKKLAAALFPVTLCHSGLRVPCSLLRLKILLGVVASCASLFVLVRACCLDRFPDARCGLRGSRPELLCVELGFGLGCMACLFVLVRAAVWIASRMLTMACPGLGLCCCV